MRTILLLASVALTQADDVAELIRKDRQALQGTWQVIAAESKGEKVPAEDVKELQLVFQGDNIQVREAGKVQDRYSYRLGPDRTPKEIDLTYTAGPKKGRTDRAIYRLDGDTLAFCIQQDAEAARPRTFATRAGTELFLVELKRK